MNEEIKIVLSPFPQPINVVISKHENIATIELSETRPTPFSAPDKNYIHTQNEPSSNWLVQHNLNKFPTLTIIDEEGVSIIGLLRFIDLNTVEINFTEPLIGKAFAN